MKQEYKVLTIVYEETAQGDGPFARLEMQVNQHLTDGWTLLGGVSVAPTLGPKTSVSTDLESRQNRRCGTPV
jgi:hypothetical protein